MKIIISLFLLFFSLNTFATGEGHCKFNECNPPPSSSSSSSSSNNAVRAVGYGLLAVGTACGLCYLMDGCFDSGWCAPKKPAKDTTGILVPPNPENEFIKSKSESDLLLDTTIRSTR